MQRRRWPDLPSSPTQPELLLNLDNPAHMRSRATVARAFSKRGVESLREHVRTTTRRNVQRMRDGELAPDLFASVLQDLTSSTVCHILGIPLQDRELFRPRSQIIQSAPPDDIPGIEVAVKASFDYLMDFVRGTRHAEPDGFIRQYVDQRASMDDPLTDEEFVGVLLGILLGGDHNALSVMTKSVYTLLCAPALWTHAQRNREQLPALIEELIRVIPIGKLSAFPRITTQAVSTSRGEIPAGTCVYANVFWPTATRPCSASRCGSTHCVRTRPHTSSSAMASTVAWARPRPAGNRHRTRDADRTVARHAAGPRAEIAGWINGTVLRRPNELPVRF